MHLIEVLQSRVESRLHISECIQFYYTRTNARKDDADADADGNVNCSRQWRVQVH